MIIDDGSTTPPARWSAQYLAQRRHPRVVFTSGQRRHCARPNVGLRLATGRYITFPSTATIC
ncbi:hypothetical protein M8494_31960 [Serratia ureilytica]